MEGLTQTTTVRQAARRQTSQRITKDRVSRLAACRLVVAAKNRKVKGSHNDTFDQQLAWRR